MNEKEKKTKKNLALPIIVESDKSQDITKGMNLYLCSFTWKKKNFINLENGEKTKVKVWTFGGLVFLNPSLDKGRHVLSHTKEPKHITNQKGEIVETVTVSKTRIVGRNYGYEALASILSAIYPCTVEKAKSLVQEGLAKNLKHAKLVLRSDLIPTSRDLYEKMGLKNEWIIIADYPSSDVMQSRINESLKLQGSPLRAKFGLKWRLTE